MNEQQLNHKKPIIVCPQEYTGSLMRIVPCNRCHNWDKTEKNCKVYTGSEHLPLVTETDIPTCPLEQTCQHNIQAQGRCAVRLRGLICASALATTMSYNDALDHPLSFHADVFNPDDND